MQLIMNNMYLDPQIAKQDDDAALPSPASERSQFYLPGLSHENLEKQRKYAKSSNDPLILYNFSLYLIDLSTSLLQGKGSEICGDNENYSQSSSIKSGKSSRKNSNETPSSLIMREALKYMKKLAYSSIALGKSPLPEAQYFLAEAYSEGTFGFPVDHDKAFNLYLQASKQNHPESTYKAAFAYENGTGTKRDSARSVQFYRKAASLGDPYAMHRLALILQKGQLNQTKNPREAITWLKRSAHIAADSNYPRPIHDLAHCYEATGGSTAVIPDDEYAFELYAKSAKLGFAPSQYRLGLCYEHGHLGTEKNAEASIAWYSKAAEQGHIESQLALSGWYLTGAEGVLRKDETEAFLWACKAAEQGYAKAEYAVGYYYETGTGVVASLPQAFNWYEKAARKNNKRASARLKELRKLIRAGRIPCPPGLKLNSSLCSIM